MANEKTDIISTMPRSATVFYSLEIAFSVVSLMFFSDVFGARLSSILPIPSPTLFRYSILGLSFLLIAQRWRTSLYTACQDKYIWGIILLLASSFFWASDSGFVLENVRAELIPMLCFSLYFASRFNITEQLKVVSWSLALAIFASVLLILVNPSIGIHQSGEFSGSWRGVFSQKNVFGIYSSFTTTVFFLWARCGSQQKRLLWGLFFCFAATVLLSGSRSAVGLTIMALLICSFYQEFRWVGKRTIFSLNILVLFLGAMGTVIIYQWGAIMTSIGRDPTLSKRTLIWSFLIREKIPEHALLGYGRGIFWHDPIYASGIEYAAHHYPAHAHNGFIDLVLDVGLIGLVLFSIAWIIAYLHSLRLTYLSQSPASLWPLVFLTLLVLFNMTESNLTRLTNIFWVLFVSLSFTLNRQRAQFIAAPQSQERQ